MKRLRMVNVDHFHVGWYQSANFGNFLSPQVLESSLAYQTSVEDSICLIFGKKYNPFEILDFQKWVISNYDLPEGLFPC